MTPSVEPALAADLREFLAQCRHVADEIGEVVALAAEMFPADPADLVVLAIGVVVAVLRVADLVAGQDQRQALRQQQAGELVLAKLAAQRHDRGIVGRAFMAAIVAVVVVGAVAIVLAVGLIVLLVVAEEIGQRETVMDGDVVDAGARLAPVMVEQIGGGGHAARHFADQAAFAAPVAPHGAAIAVVPFRPLRGKCADLVAAHAEIPGLGDELCTEASTGSCRIAVRKAAVAVEAVRSARQRGGEIEAEAVDMADLDPVAQRIHHHLQHARMGEVDRGAAAGEVVVIALEVVVEALLSGFSQ